MVGENNMISPLVTAALAAALVVYIPQPLFRLVFFAASALFVVSMLIRQKNAVFCRRKLLPLGLAVLGGAGLGLWAVSAVDSFAPGLPAEKIFSLKGKLLDDPRSFAASAGFSLGEERGMAALELRETGAAMPGNVRASAHGRVPVFFPAGTMPRLREFGRGSEVYVEGHFLPETAPGVSSLGGLSPRFRAVSVHTVSAAPVPERFRTAVRTALLERLKPKTWGGLAAALLLGTRENLEGDLPLLFRNTGLSHILALSGMHLAFLSALLTFMLKKPLGKKGALMAGLCFIVFYVVLVGPQPSLVRAAIMYVLGSCLVLCGISRPSSMLPSTLLTTLTLALLGAAFLVQIILDPASAGSISFILSYLALGGILLFSGRIETLLRGRLPPFLANGLGVSAAAFLVTAPVVVLFFAVLRPVGIAAGLIAAPLSSLFMALSLLWLAAAPVPLLGTILDKGLGLLQQVIKGSLTIFAGVPGFTAALPVVCAAVAVTAAALFFCTAKTAAYRSYLAPFV